MDFILLSIVLALGISTVLNLALKRIGVSQIIGYILTGTLLIYMLSLKGLNHSVVLEHIGDFGVVFLMFTIGLEISLEKMNSMKKEIFLNGFLQVGGTALILYGISHYLLNLEVKPALVLSLAFSLSSTAVVLSYLKTSKEIYSPYGQRSTGILIFQDIAVIPILILLTFLTQHSTLDISTILIETFSSAFVVVGLLFIIGKRVMTWLLHFSASSEVDELFMSSVFFIVISASLLASSMGFTYSLGAFIAGMIIAETKYHHKVESDIAPFKNLLLGVFFIVVGMKIDVMFFIDNFFKIFTIFFLTLIIKTFVTFVTLRFSVNSSTALKSALSLSQVGEFSFVIFAIASLGGIFSPELNSILILVVILSMMITPFFIVKINSFVDYLIKDTKSLLDIDEFQEREDHVIVCGYSVIGKFVAMMLDEIDAKYVIIDNSPKHINEALKDGHEAYLGDMSKLPIIESLNTKKASSIIITLDNIDKKRAICEAVLKQTNQANVIVKVTSLEDKNTLSNLGVTTIVDGKLEVSRVLVERVMTCQLNAHHNGH